MLICEVFEVMYVGRCSGWVEFDEYVEGVYISEFDVGIKFYDEFMCSMDDIKCDICVCLVNLLVVISIG